ncbi:MAG: leucine-rich repeat domain-containing protein [Bacteroidales bacterium]|nr:leucine-rich repeat domain-containing protein [Bacteroidales bacterium]
MKESIVVCKSKWVFLIALLISVLLVFTLSACSTIESEPQFDSSWYGTFTSYNVENKGTIISINKDGLYIDGEKVDCTVENNKIKITQSGFILERSEDGLGLHWMISTEFWNKYPTARSGRISAATYTKDSTGKLVSSWTLSENGTTYVSRYNSKGFPETYSGIYVLKDGVLVEKFTSMGGDPISLYRTCYIDEKYYVYLSHIKDLDKYLDLFESSLIEEETKHIHEYGEWEIITPATCISIGKRKKKCACGKEVTEIYSLPHTWEIESTNNQESLHSGEKSYTCSVCHATKTGNSVIASNNLFVDDAGYIINIDGEHLSLIGYNGSEKNLTLPEGIKEIGENVFYEGNVNLVSIPSSVIRIGNDAFYSCKDLNEVLFAEDSHLEEIGDRAFSFCFSLTTIRIPKSVKKLGSAVFLTNDYYIKGRNSFCLESVVFEEGSQLRVVSDHAFYECRNLKSIIIPETISTIGYGAFSQTGLTSFDIPDSVTIIEEYAFEDCRSLKNLVIPTSVIQIAGNAFLTFSSATIPVKYLGTMSQWTEILDQSVRDFEITHYTVQCKDGDLTY